MRYVPSPIPLAFTYIYSATANKSGRMQYHRQKPGLGKARIGRAEFIKAYNDASILALRPIQQPGLDAVFQMEFYV